MLTFSGLSTLIESDYEKKKQQCNHHKQNYLPNKLYFSASVGAMYSLAPFALQLFDASSHERTMSLLQKQVSPSTLKPSVHTLGSVGEELGRRNILTTIPYNPQPSWKMRSSLLMSVWFLNVLISN